MNIKKLAVTLLATIVLPGVALAEEPKPSSCGVLINGVYLSLMTGACLDNFGSIEMMAGKGNGTGSRICDSLESKLLNAEVKLDDADDRLDDHKDATRKIENARDKMDSFLGGINKLLAKKPSLFTDDYNLLFGPATEARACVNGLLPTKLQDPPS